MLRFMIEHPYIFGGTLIGFGLWALVYVLWWRAMDGDYTARIEDD